MKKFVIFALLLTLCSFVRAEEPITIDCNFPGGNIIVDSIKDGVARVRPDLRDTTSEWFYYAFRVRNA